MRFGPETFEVTEEHLKLLRAAYVDWDDCEFGAPAINCKRPYGNNNVVGDIIEILGWDRQEDRDGDLLEEQREEATRIHKETQTVLQIILNTGAMKAGRYVKRDPYGGKWEPLP